MGIKASQFKWVKFRMHPEMASIEDKNSISEAFKKLSDSSVL